MIAKQYTINLPADYDMGIVRRRVAERGSVFDDWPGLDFKAFLISEVAAGASANRCAPFYVWRDTAGANEFLYGDGFAGLASAFGRPLIEHWIGLGMRVSGGATPRSATREDVLVRDGDDLAHVRERELTRLESAGDAYAAVVALDPYRWQLVRFALWSMPVGELGNLPGVTAYEVLHLSAP